MIKRIIWVTAGFGAGLSSSLWMKRVVKRRAADYTNSVATNFLANRVKATKSTLLDVAQEAKRIATKYEDMIPTRSNQQSRKSLLILND